MVTLTKQRLPPAPFYTVPPPTLPGPQTPCFPPAPSHPLLSPPRYCDGICPPAPAASSPDAQLDLLSIPSPLLTQHTPRQDLCINPIPSAHFPFPPPLQLLHPAMQQHSIFLCILSFVAQPVRLSLSCLPPPSAGFTPPNKTTHYQPTFKHPSPSHITILFRVSSSSIWPVSLAPAPHLMSMLGAPDDSLFLLHPFLQHDWSICALCAICPPPHHHPLHARKACVTHVHMLRPVVQPHPPPSRASFSPSMARPLAH
jgi:hypothetical protein